MYKRQGIEGWKEFELELMRDRNDNVVVVCPIENVDPVGVHTGDSITVAPCFTLTDREYQKLRDIGIAIIRGVGVDTGGCNIQFAVHPDTGRIIVIDPREFNQEGKPTLDLAAFAADQGVDDLVVINYPYMINSKAFVRYLNALAGVK